MNFNKIACLLLSLVLVISLFSVSVLATEAADTVADSEVADTSVAATDTDAPVAVESEEETPADSVEDETPDESEAEESVEDATDDEKADGAKEESKKISTGTIVSIAITLVIVVIAAIYCIKNKEKVAKFFRECKSEIKKITWTPKNQVVKNTFVVIVVVVIAAIFIALLDLLFSTGIGSLVSL